MGLTPVGVRLDKVNTQVLLSGSNFLDGSTNGFIGRRLENFTRTVRKPNCKLFKTNSSQFKDLIGKLGNYAMHFFHL